MLQLVSCVCYCIDNVVVDHVIVCFSSENVESSLTSEKSSSEVVPVDLPSPHDPPGMLYVTI